MAHSQTTPKSRKSQNVHRLDPSNFAGMVRDPVLEVVSADVVSDLSDRLVTDGESRFFAVGAIRTTEKDGGWTDVLYVSGDGQEVVNVEYQRRRDDWHLIPGSIAVDDVEDNPSPTPAKHNELVKKGLEAHAAVSPYYDDAPEQL